MCRGREGGGDGRVKSNGCLTEKGEKETQELTFVLGDSEDKASRLSPACLQDIQNLNRGTQRNYETS